jgi:cytochrome c553
MSGTPGAVITQVDQIVISARTCGAATMNLKLITTLLVSTSMCAILGASAALAQETASAAPAGQAKAAACAACHGIDGNSVNPEWPSLAGQHPSYIAKQLRLFKSGARPSSVMVPQAQPLSEQDIDDLSTYFAAQPQKGLEADKAKVALGQRIYRGGNAATKVPACLACHGPDGRGNLPANYPAIRGQQATYVSAQLNAYKAGQRTTDLNKIMRNVTASMSADEIAAVASYVQGIR